MSLRLSCLNLFKKFSVSVNNNIPVEVPENILSAVKSHCGGNILVIQEIVKAALELEVIPEVQTAGGFTDKILCDLTMLMNENRSAAKPAFHNNKGEAFIL